MLTGGQVRPLDRCEALLEGVSDGATLPGDKGYDTNTIDRMFGRLTDLRPIASRDDHLASGAHAALCRVAVVRSWI